MIFDLFTLFPEMFAGPTSESILKRAQQAELINIQIHNIRDWTYDKHHTADDRPFGGGAGMVMKVGPIVEGVESVLQSAESGENRAVLVMAASGRTFDQAFARELATLDRLVIVCGHYEGIDARATSLLGATEVSIGDYVLTGGELPAMVIVDAVARLVPGVITEQSADEESHGAFEAEYPHYTRPEEYRGEVVPPVLLSGHHAEIRKWREEQARLRAELLKAETELNGQTER